MTSTAHDPSLPDASRDVVAELDEAAHSVPMEGIAGAAVRSMVISAVVVGGLVWLWRSLMHERRWRGTPED
jgi:hypothetical protein